MDPHNLIFGKKQLIEEALANYRHSRENCPEPQRRGLDILIQQAEAELAKTTRAPRDQAEQ